MTSLRRTREVAGPGLSGPAVIARMPLDRPAEHMILTRRAENESRRVFEDKLFDESKIRQRIAFQENTDARIRQNTVTARTSAIVATMDAALDARRAKLAALLEAEEVAYTQEVGTKAETEIERLAKMRSRAAALREKRESERAALAAEKTGELWRTNCEPLRTAMCSTEHRLIDEDRRQQLAFKAAEAEAQAEVDALYAACWESDRIAKEERDQRDVAAQTLRNRETQAVQIGQMNETQHQKHLEMMATGELQTLRLETAKEIEEEMRQQELAKRSAQRRLKGILDRDSSKRTAYAAAHRGAALAEETAMLEGLEQERRDEQRMAFEQKRAMADEQQAYFDYLKSFADQRSAFEAEVDAAIAAEGERVWQDRLTKMRAERAHRKELVQDILQARKAQMGYKMQQVQATAAQKIADKQALDADFAAFTLETTEKQAALRATNRNHQAELTTQAIQIQAAAAAARATAAADEQALQASFKATDERIDLAVTAVRMGTQRKRG